MGALHRVYFVPGMFGFAQLAGYDYFTHLRVGLEQRFAKAGVRVSIEDVPSPPTSSLRHRSRILARTISDTCGDSDGPIHIVGHSTGGLDMRLVLSPSTKLGIDRDALRWVPRTRTAISMSTPHYGTPLAGYFATVSGTRVLYALSLLTVVSLSVGEPSLAVFSRLLAGLGSIDSLLGSDLRLVSRVTDGLLRFVDRDGRGEILGFLAKVRTDQGAIIQIMPEAMDLFNAAAEDHPEVRYGSVATAAPPPRTMRFVRRMTSPYAAFTGAIYSTVYQFASQRPRRYEYAYPNPAQQELFEHGISFGVTDANNDGIVPTLSMLWGELLWAGEADHLDVLGHFHDDVRPSTHRDWLTSGALFDRQRFASLLDAIADFQLRDASP
jgi:hypothetical protein